MTIKKIEIIKTKSDILAFTKQLKDEITFKVNKKSNRYLSKNESKSLNMLDKIDNIINEKFSNLTKD
ncbi:MAG: hypothetical protein ACRCXE_03270 [Metamycoplasmataceae bacterium]